MIPAVLDNTPGASIVNLANGCHRTNNSTSAHRILLRSSVPLALLGVGSACGGCVLPDARSFVVDTVHPPGPG